MEIYYKVPVAFAERLVMKLTSEEVKENRFGRRLEPETKQILTAVAKHDYVTIPAGRGVTKTTSLAILALWWIFTRPHSKVAATGPKFDQLKITLWREIQKWLNQSHVKGLIKWSAENISHVEPEMDAFGQILTSKEKENIAGIHNEHVLWIIDEASNVDDVMIDTILGGMTDPESKIVMAGNPTRTSGPFYKSFTSDRNDWHVIHLSSEDCQRKNPLWFKRMQKHPRESDSYRVWVLGLPPRGNPQAIISLESCEMARNREVFPSASDPFEIGFDPAWEGDDLSTLGVRWGMKYCETKYYSKTTPQQEYRYVLDTIRDYRQKTNWNGKVRVKVDAGGGFGKGLIELLILNESDNIECVPVHNNAAGTEEYQDYGTYLWYHMADIINSIELPSDDELIEELSTREWKPVDKGKVKAESKKDYKKRLGRSPDRADACILAFAEGPKKVFPRKYNSEQETKSFEVDWNRKMVGMPGFYGPHLVEALHYAALVINNDLSLNGLAAIYEFIRDKLWIYKEFYQEIPDIEPLSVVVKQATRHNMLPGFECRILGGETMFRSGSSSRGTDNLRLKSGRPLADIALNHNFVILEPYMYDELGAVALGVSMFQADNVIIHPDLKLARMQIGLWSMKKGHFEENTGFCKALLLILSEIKAQKRMKIPPKTYNLSRYSHFPHDYRDVAIQSPEKERKDLAWMTR